LRKREGRDKKRGREKKARKTEIIKLLLANPINFN
jgi:hypothetical protein